MTILKAPLQERRNTCFCGGPADSSVYCAYQANAGIVLHLADLDVAFHSLPLGALQSNETLSVSSSHSKGRSHRLGNRSAFYQALALLPAHGCKQLEATGMLRHTLIPLILLNKHLDEADLFMAEIFQNSSQRLGVHTSAWLCPVLSFLSGSVKFRAPAWRVLALMAKAMTSVLVNARLANARNSSVPM